jgi:putative ABC transport system permease protein
MAASGLLARPARTVLTMFGIVLGVSVIIAVSITNESTLASLNTVFGEVAGNSDLMVMSSTVDREGFAEDARKRVVSVPGVEVAAPSVHARAVLAGDTSEREFKAGILGGVNQNLTVYGVDPRLDPQVRVYKLVEGEWLANDLDLYEIVLVEDFAVDEEIEVGDDLPLLTPNGVELVRVIGLISKEGAGQLNNGLFGAMPLNAVQRMYSRAGDLDQIDIIVSEQIDSTHHLEALRDVLGEKLGERFSVTFPASQGERVSQMLGIYQMGLSMFGVIAVFVGTFLIYNAFSMTVVERTREIGMLRTIGMTRGQVTRRIMIEAVVLGVLGSVLGIIGGLLLAGGLIRAMAALIAREVPETSIPASGLISGVTVGIIATLLAALIPSWQAGRVSPLEALRVRGQHKEGWLVRRGWILGAVFVAISLAAYLVPDVPPEVQFPVMNGAIFGLFTGATLLTPLTVGPWERVARPLVRAIFGGEGRLGGSNIQRARMRTTMTVTALMVGVAMLLSMRAMSASMQGDLTEWIEGYMGGDLVVFSATPMQLEFGSRLEAIEGVQAASPSRRLDVTVMKPGGSNETLAMNIIDPVKHEQVGSFTFTATMGDEQRSMARFAQGDAVFLSTLVADRYRLAIGDMLTIQTRRGLRDFEVAGVVVDFMDQGMVIQGNWRDMRQYFRIDDVSSFRIAVKPGYEAKDVMDTIEDIYGTRRNLGTFSNEVVKEMALGITAQTTGLFGVLSWIAVIVASLGVVNTLLMNVMERTREIGMLRGVGMTRWQVVRMILAEAAVMGTIGGGLGTGVGTVLARVFIVAANAMQGYNLTYVMPAQALVFAFAVAVGVSQIAALWPSGRAARLRIIEAIQYE